MLSQVDDHAIFGGVVPEIAARAHVEKLDGIIAAALRDAGIGFADIDAVAATAGPGLIGGVLVGLTTAKAIALAAKKPLIAVNHLEGHALTAAPDRQSAVSPTSCCWCPAATPSSLSVEGVGQYRRMGTTIDDALGEAFDKAAKLLGLPYPGGPAVEAAPKRGNPIRFALPRPPHRPPRQRLLLLRPQDRTPPRCRGDRAAVRSGRRPTSARPFQAAVTDVVSNRARHAIAQFVNEHQVPGILVVAGGVAANEAIRVALRAEAERHAFRVVAPPIRLCADNAAMIAWAGAERLALGLTDTMEFAARPRWPLDATSEPAFGSGAKGAKA